MTKVLNTFQIKSVSDYCTMYNEKLLDLAKTVERLKSVDIWSLCEGVVDISQNTSGHPEYAAIVSWERCH